MEITQIIINNGTHRLPHFWPLTSVKKTCFYQNCHHPKSYFYHTVQIFGNFSLKDPKSAGISENMPKCPLFLWLLSLNNPLFFCLAYMCFRGMLLPQIQKLKNFVFLKHNCAIWCILIGANLIKVVKTKFQFCRLNRPNCALWKNFIGGQGVIRRPSPWSNSEEDISYNHPL